VWFERFKLRYTIPESSHTYTPDLLLPNGIVLEGKGLLTTEDKKKMRLVKAQHPDVDIRFVFSNANAKIAKQSKTRYRDWADKYGFQWAHREIPKEWMEEGENGVSINALKVMGCWPAT